MIVSAKFELTPSANPIVLTPCTFFPGASGPFDVSIYVKSEDAPYVSLRDVDHETKEIEEPPPPEPKKQNPITNDSGFSITKPTLLKQEKSVKIGQRTSIVTTPISDTTTESNSGTSLLDQIRAGPKLKHVQVVPKQRKLTVSGTIFSCFNFEKILSKKAQLEKVEEPQDNEDDDEWL